MKKSRMTVRLFVLMLAVCGVMGIVLALVIPDFITSLMVMVLFLGAVATASAWGAYLGLDVYESDLMGRNR